MFTLLLAAPALAASPVWGLLPFGIGAYAHDKPARGVVYTATQAIGLGTLIASQVAADRALDEGDDDTFATAQAAGAVGATLGVGSYFVGIVDTAKLHEIEVEKARAAVMAWDRAREVARAGRP